MPGEDTGSGSATGGGLGRGFGSYPYADPPPDTPGAPDFSITNQSAAKPPPGISGKTMDLSEYHMVFEVEQSAYSTPWKLTVRVYNLEQNLMQAIAKEYTQVQLEAGYLNGPKGIIFNGLVSYFELGRENNTDLVLIIHAAEADLAWNETPVNATLPAGSTAADVVNACQSEMDKNGKIKLGAMSALSTGQSPRARTLYGQSKDILRDVTQSNNATAFISDGKINVVTKDEVLKLPTVVLNSTSGMIGIPYQTLDGAINVRSLLNPQLKPAGSVQINEKDIRQIAVKNAGLAASDLGTIGFFDDHNQIHTDGLYKVYALTHTGDTRGNDWYTDIVTDKIRPDQMKPSLG
jgi:hypothetical protein